jgi:hypothetical protein
VDSKPVGFRPDRGRCRFCPVGLRIEVPEIGKVGVDSSGGVRIETWGCLFRSVSDIRILIRRTKHDLIIKPNYKSHA